MGLCAVTSTDSMTADFYASDMKFLGETATRIIDELKGVNRRDSEAPDHRSAIAFHP